MTTINFSKEENKTMTPAQKIQSEGYESLGSMTDRRKKKYSVYEREGKMYAFRGYDLQKEVIKLEDVSDLDLN